MRTIESDGFYYLDDPRDLMLKGDKINPQSEPMKWGKINKRIEARETHREVKANEAQG